MVNATLTLFLVFNVSNTLIPVLHKVYSYGKAPTSFGISKVEEEEPTGPYSFAIGGPDNSIYIPDPVNGDIKVISSSTGDIVKTIKFTGYFDDIRVDKSGRIYILDRTGERIIRLDETGKSSEVYTLDYETVKNPCKLMLDKDRVLIKNSSILYNPETKVTFYTPYEAGIHNGNLDIFYHKPDGTLSQIASLKVKGIVSAEVLGTDRAGNIYVQIEVKRDPEGVYLKVLKFKTTGTLIGEYTIPENDYFVWTARLLDIDENGAIYQILPKEDHLEINIWKTE